MLSNYNGYALILGAGGAVGNSCVSIFRANNWWVGCVELWKTLPIKVSLLYY